MPHSGIFVFFYIAGKEEWQSMQELIESQYSGYNIFRISIQDPMQK